MYRQITMGELGKVYKGTRWRKKRKVIFRRDGYLCRHCRRYGRTRESQMVHHIIPVEVIPELLYENENLLSLCNKCHSKMHDRINDRLTDEGLGWVKRIPLLKEMWESLEKIKGVYNK